MDLTRRAAVLTNCRHERATWLRKRPGNPVAYRCPDCGAVAVSGSYTGALVKFRLKVGIFLPGISK